MRHSPRILVAPTCLKGSLSANDAADILADFLAGYFSDHVEIDVCPVADGGDDTLAVLQEADKGYMAQSCTVMGPVSEMTVKAQYLVHPGNKLAVLEAAQAHGYRLLVERGLAPLSATSYGVGQMLASVIQRHPDLERIVLALGGSSSTDGGLGALQALGVRFLDETGNVIAEPIGGGHLAAIREVQWLPCWPYDGELLIATDVHNPLLGENGTAAVFAPQKGATQDECRLLDQSLCRVSQFMQQACGTAYQDVPGVGAAGGLAYGLLHLPKARIVSGSQWILDTLGVEDRLQQASLVITTEGRVDSTTFQGKAIGQLLELAGQKPVFIFCGQMQKGLQLPENVQIFPLVALDAELNDIQAAIKQPRPLLERCLNEANAAIQAVLEL
ncbi:MAG TPA: glycerate kinase [Oculatellaceae cyanobacterium]|jgi:glycerate kinase